MMGALLRDGLPMSTLEKRQFYTPRELREQAEAERRKAIAAAPDISIRHMRRSGSLVEAALTLERSKVLL